MTGIRLKSIVKVPAKLVGTDGVTIDHSGGQVTIGLDETVVPSFPEEMTIGDVFYASSSTTLESVPPNTTVTEKILAQTGDGTTAGAPSWVATSLVVDSSKVLKTGDTMSGHLVLPTGPASSNAVRKDYVDAADAAVLPFDTVALAAASTIAVTRSMIVTNGYLSVGDGGGAHYKRMVSSPSHEGKFQSLDGSWWEISEPVFNVRMFGAVGDGVANDAPAINNAIAALPVQGGTVILPVGKYNITNSIVIGDGTTTAVSTRHGVKLIGEGLPGGADAFVVGMPVPSVHIIWSGSSASAMIDVRGPLRGIEVSNLILNCNNVANYGFRATSVSNFRNDFLTILNARIVGYLLACHTKVYPISCNCDQGMINCLQVTCGDVAGAVGIKCDGATDGTASTCFVNFVGARVYTSGSFQNDGIVLKVADTVMFSDALVFGVGGFSGLDYSQGHQGFVFDYTGNAVFPGGCVLNGVDVGWNIQPAAKQFVVVGTPSARPNYVNNITEVNGGRYPTNVANVQLDLPKKIPADVYAINATAAILATPMYAVVNAGLYRVNYYLTISVAGSGGNIRFCMTFSDGVTRQANGTYLSAAGYAGTVSGSLVFYSNAGGIHYSIEFAAVTGSPAYTMFASLERLM